jgi:hypothetical protein
MKAMKAKPAGEPENPADPCSPRVEIIDGERWIAPGLHKLREHYTLGGHGQLTRVSCKRCGRMWFTTPLEVEIPQPVVEG